jgi:hypothetical protein
VEAVCHFAMDNAATRRLFRFVVGQWNFWITQEVQQLIAMRREAIDQFARGFAPDSFLQQLIKLVFNLRYHSLKALHRHPASFVIETIA